MISRYEGANLNIRLLYATFYIIKNKVAEFFSEMIGVNLGKK